MELRIEVLCDGLPGARFADPHAGPSGVYTDLRLGIQRGREVIAAVASCRRRAVGSVTRGPLPSAKLHD